MASSFPLSSAARNQRSATAAKVLAGSHHRNVLGILITLDVLGVIVMLMGLRQQFHHQGILPETIDGPYAGVMMVVAGVILTLPFFVWSFKASFRPFGTLKK